jgi:hypothetical protein
MQAEAANKTTTDKIESFIRFSILRNIFLDLLDLYLPIPLNQLFQALASVTRYDSIDH